MWTSLVEIQRSIHAALSADIAAFASGGSWAALLSVLPLGIVFGAAHALTPGHSKSVLAAYVLGAGQSPRRALATAFVLTLTHIGSAIVLSLFASGLITRTIVGAGQAPALLWTSRLMLVAAGLWLIVNALRKMPLTHGAHFHGETIGFGLFAGLVPCPLTLFIMTFALSRGVPEAGLAFSAAMLVGVGLVLTLIALAAALSRGTLLRLLLRHDASLDRLVRLLNAAAGALLIALAMGELPL